MKNGEITTDNTEIQRIIRDYYQQQYSNKMDNLGDMDEFLEKYKLPKLTQEEIENFNRPITNMEIETVIFQQAKAKDQMASQLNSTKNLERVNIYSAQTLPKNCRRRQTSKLILCSHHHPNTKTGQRCHKK